MPPSLPSRRRLLAIATGAVAAATLPGCAGTSPRPPASSTTTTPALPWATAELPGGGRTIFPQAPRRYVALYGHPGSRRLGALGEQDVDASIERVKALAADYQAIDGTPAIPTLEIIATVAIGTPGPLGTYSAQWPVEKYLPWVQAAQAAGVAVVLDLQPGTADLLDQAKAYQSLLEYPHVGLAVDPEWKLAPGQKPLTTIGQVDAAEINTVSQWLAELVAQQQLPQKLFVIHQFRADMVRQRDTLVTSHPELAVVIHVDGQGRQRDKQATWRAIRAGAPAGVHWGWKNFYDEDEPMLTPRQTLSRVEPTPSLITYQ